jgi:hypothetical protein
VTRSNAIPELDPGTGYLPFRGEDPYRVSLDDIEERYITTPHREHVWEAFGRWLTALNTIGVPGVLRFGGSLLTDKEQPSDVDVLVAIPAESQASARRLIVEHPHLWTWQNFGTQDPAGQWKRVADKVQPALGLVDAYMCLVGAPPEANFARDWTSEHDDEGLPTGVRMGWLEVAR